MRRPISFKRVMWVGAALVLFGLVAFVVAGIVCFPVLTERARADRARLDLSSFNLALNLYYTKHRAYPSESAGLHALVDDHILEELRNDPWGRPYQYELRNGRPNVFTLGADGAPGGTGEDQDISMDDLSHARN